MFTSPGDGPSKFAQGGVGNRAGKGPTFGSMCVGTAGTRNATICKEIYTSPQLMLLELQRSRTICELVRIFGRSCRVIVSGLLFHYLETDLLD